MKKNLLIIASKYPAEGEVKTRLGESIGMPKAAEFARDLLFDLIDNHKNKNYDLMIETDKLSRLDDFKKLISNVPIHVDMGNFLRGKNSLTFKIFKHFLNRYRKVVLVSSDTPKIDELLINKALSLLNYSDVVLGPDFDGGYYLVGMSKPVDLFSNLPESRGPYLEMTLDFIQKSKLKYVMIDTLTDIDYLDDFKKVDLDDKDGKWERTKVWIKKFQ